MIGTVTGRTSSRTATLDAARQRIVVDATVGRIEEATYRYGIAMAPVAIRFDLRGASAGIYRSDGRERLIRYNVPIFARYFGANLEETVPHEVAHYVVDVVFGRRGVRPHGVQWRDVMSDFGVPATVRHDWNLDGLGVRRQRRFTYRCGCGVHEVTAVRHNRIRDRGAVYRCRRCRAPLEPT